jgi:peptidoglycan/xylan/chitin deacetylase (PgdA/CDA1 family)
MRKCLLPGIWLLLLLLAAGCGGEIAQTAADASLPAEERYLALTFDDGPHPGTTDLLLDGLRERGASATFFLVGEEAQRYPELVQRMAEEGHQVGNHTWSHVRLEGTASESLQEVGRTEALLSQLLGGRQYWLRPPYGLLTADTAAQLTVPAVTWSVDPRAWESRDTEQVVQAVLQDVKPNSIILLHDIYPTSVEAALRLVDTLQAEGYWFVTVEELLALNGITPQAGSIYRSGAPQT